MQRNARAVVNVVSRPYYPSSVEIVDSHQLPRCDSGVNCDSDPVIHVGGSCPIAI